MARTRFSRWIRLPIATPSTCSAAIPSISDAAPSWSSANQSPEVRFDSPAQRTRGQHQPEQRHDRQRTGGVVPDIVPGAGAGQRTQVGPGRSWSVHEACEARVSGAEQPPEQTKSDQRGAGVVRRVMGQARVRCRPSARPLRSTAPAARNRAPAHPRPASSDRRARSRA
jgi:hypothetical protein